MLEIRQQIFKNYILKIFVEAKQLLDSQPSFHNILSVKKFPDKFLAIVFNCKLHELHESFSGEFLLRCPIGLHL